MVRRGTRKQDWTTRDTEPIWPKFLNQYLETALWASTDPEGNPLDRDYSIEDFSDEALLQAIQESNNFIQENLKDLEMVGDEGAHGHDFFLTRNGHGAGFWDRGYGPVGKRLTSASKRYGTADVYVGDDRQLHFG